MCPVLDDPELEEGMVLDGPAEIGRRVEEALTSWWVLRGRRLGVGDVPGPRAGGSGEGGAS